MKRKIQIYYLLGLVLSLNTFTAFGDTTKDLMNRYLNDAQKLSNSPGTLQLDIDIQLRKLVIMQYFATCEKSPSCKAWFLNNEKSGGVDVMNAAQRKQLLEQNEWRSKHCNGYGCSQEPIR